MVRQPGVEPGAKAWEASMLPIHHWRKTCRFLLEKNKIMTHEFGKWISPQSLACGIGGPLTAGQQGA